ncbi:unnamed protein product [Chironomus riparius]|uniref:AB hydrolase-1 domain-containing protein n=1 Tax=Chironomus riparius TaxID=315576 RepID=A0A9N9S491_9DIPT|nr:unnamed protein product [Chironomus riparius]
MIEELQKYKSDQLTDIKITEVQINLSNGMCIAGKWWGNLKKKPILCLHGWQDNAGTFDRLIPLLPREFSYLAIDLLGHGRSSWLPRGVPYNLFDNVYTIIYIMKEYNWQSISILGHSMGGAIAFLFSIMFPDKLDCLVTIEFGKNPDRSDIERIMDARDNILNFIVLDEKSQAISEPPSYTLEEMIEKVHVGSFGNITSESAPYILERNIKKSFKVPGKYFFSRDPRLRNLILTPHPENLTLCGAKNMTAPYLFLYSPESPLFAKEFFFDQFLEASQENSKFQQVLVDSESHHYHLNEVEKISEVVAKFLIENQKVIHHL